MNHNDFDADPGDHTPQSDRAGGSADPADRPGDPAEPEGEGQESAAIVALVADLMFASRIRGAAPGARTVQRADALREAVGPGTRLVLVDLQARGAVEAIPTVTGSATVVAFGPHVDTESLQAARAAGAHRVLARSAFVRELPALVREVLG